MPRFYVRRDVPGLTIEDVDAAAFRALACAAEIDGLEWIESAFDPSEGVFFCLYDAEDEEQIREHLRRARIPCDEVREVVTIRPLDYVQAPAETKPTPVSA